MKITFVTKTWVSLNGGLRSIAIYASLLKQRGHDVYVVCPAKDKPSLRQQIRSLIKGKGRISSQNQGLSHFDHTDIPRQILNHTAPITDVDLPDADVVIASWWETAYWVNNLSPSKGAKAYFVQHHEVHDYVDKKRAAATYRLPLHKITIADWLVNIMANEYGDRDVSKVHIGVDLNQFQAVPRGKQAIPTVGMMYSKINWKGCDISLKAFSLARQKIPNLRLVAFSMHDLVPELPLPEGAEFVMQPPQSQLKDFYSQCDGWLFGSRLEGFGMPILEAMACRTPVIATPAGIAPEIITPETGILVPHESPEEMARGIEQICQMSQLDWVAMSNAAYDTAQGFTWEKSTDLFEEALNRVVQSSNQLVYR
ncbi:MAG: glycosyltransferase family 4 protein [Microcoleaceae cyanobacterium]